MPALGGGDKNRESKVILGYTVGCPQTKMSKTNKTRSQKWNQDCSEKSSLALCLPVQIRTHNSVFLERFRAMQFPTKPRLSTAFHSDV